MKPSPPTTDPSSDRRRFLGWEKAALSTAVTELIHRYRDPKQNWLDLGKVIVVVPGQRAGRRLVELLVDAADRERLLFTPPVVVTAGQLPEYLYQPQRPFALSLVQRLAWAAAVRSLEPAPKAAVFPNGPTDQDHNGWLRLGDLLGRIDSELAAEGHDTDDVIRLGGAVAGFADQARWTAIGAARKAYREHLDVFGCWDQNAARLAALANREITCDFDIILVGVVDLNAVVKQMLAQIAERVTAFVFAPADLARRFDAYGSLNVAEWKSASVPLNDDQIRFVDGPTEQAATAVEWLAGLNGEYAVEEIVVGMPDPSVAPALRRRLARAGVRTRWVEESTLGDAAPFQLLAAAAEYAASHRYEAFAALVRHPDLETWMVKSGAALDLNALDAFHSEHLPARINEKFLPKTDAADAVRPAIACVGNWLAAACEPHPLREWAEIFETMLRDVYAVGDDLDLDCESDRILYATLSRTIEALRELRLVPPPLDVPLAASDAFAVALEPLATEPLPPPTEPEAVQLLGWLELPLDDAPAALIASFNEGVVPAASGMDAFLPDALRRHLGIEHDDRRYARDAYATTVLALSKKRLLWVVPRRDSARNPLAPSRLLFACSDAELIARADRWVRGGDTLVAAEVDGVEVKSPFAVPKPIKRGVKKAAFYVTEFRDFLACPYRYYLRHIEKLEAIDDAARELGGDVFGSLIHQVLLEWGNDEKWRHCPDADELAGHLSRRLKKLAAERFGDGRPAVRLQLVQAARRLTAFAVHQVSLVVDGWRIVFAERTGHTPSVSVEMSDGNVSICGRIDRIDYCAATKTVRILDYKTGDSTESPDKKHGGKNGWTDLQLPLYRHLWRQCVDRKTVPEDVSIELGFFQIPKNPAEVCVAIAEWDNAELAAADAVAREVIQRIQAEDFDQPTSPAPAYSEAFAAICLDNQQVPALADEDGGDQ